MAFKLTKFQAYGIRHEGAVRSHAEQVAELHVTALAADVLYDLGVSGGTFWTSAVADATYGGLAAEARDFLINRLAPQATVFTAVESQTLGSAYSRVPGAPGAATDYRVQAPTVIPTVSFLAANGPTSMILKITWRLKDGQEPLVKDLGGQV